MPLNAGVQTFVQKLKPDIRNKNHYMKENIEYNKFSPRFSPRYNAGLSIFVGILFLGTLGAKLCLVPGNGHF